MRPRNQTVRDQLPALLRRQPGARSADLASLAQTSPATMVRALKEAAADIVRVGKAGRTRYYLRRALRGQAENIPVYRIDRMGQASQVGQLQLLAPDGCYWDVQGDLQGNVQSMGWPVSEEFANGVWNGLPYPFQDMWPQGFLGRSFARHVAAEFRVPDNPKSWSDDDALQVLTQRGSDCTGDLIMGDGALQRWLQSKLDAPEVMAEDALGSHYLQMAEQAASLGLAGSSAAGEFPKFTALRGLQGRLTPHVIVKFSGATGINSGSTTVQRWSDLLVCEHLALETIRSLGGVEGAIEDDGECAIATGVTTGIRSAKSRLIQSGGRTFLEVERFDRHGRWGRSPLCSLATLEASILSSSSDNWVELAQEMVGRGWLDEAIVRQLNLITLFGRLIQNTDMHKGNMSLVPGPVMQLAPVYDMLPMAYAPLGGGELPTIVFAPQLPMPQQHEYWVIACTAAITFWKRAAGDLRISGDFRAICHSNAQTLETLQRLQGN